MTGGKIFNACVRSVLLYGSECWAMRKEDKARLERNDRAMLRWICGVKISDRVSVDFPLPMFGNSSTYHIVKIKTLKMVWTCQSF